MIPRRQPMSTQALDITAMAPPPPMQFSPLQAMQPMTAPAGGQQQANSGQANGMDSLMQLAQMYRQGQVAKQGQQAAAVQGAESDSPLQRRKVPFEELMGAAASAYA